MTLEEAKKKMLKYKDFWGGEMMYSEEIKAAKTKEELDNIFCQYESHIEDMASDAISHLNDFKKTLNLGDNQ